MRFGSMRNRRIYESEDQQIVLNTKDLVESGLECSLNDLRDEFQDQGAVVTGSFNEDGIPLMTIIGLDEDDILDILSDYGIDDLDDAIEDVELDFDNKFDSDLDSSDEEDDEEDDLALDLDSSDEEDDDLDNESIYVDDDIDYINEKRHSNFQKRFKKNKPLGTQNVSESVTHAILTEVKDNALKARIINKYNKKRLYENSKKGYSATCDVKLDGKRLWAWDSNSLRKKLSEAKLNYSNFYKKYRTLNESSDYKKNLKIALKKQSKLIKILESELIFRDKRANALNEDQLANLTAIKFKVKDADEFIKTLVDNGIPEEALEKESGPDEGSDEKIGSDETAQQSQDQDQGQAPMQGQSQPQPQAGQEAQGQGENPFESIRYKKGHALNEDENPFDDDTENPFGDDSNKQENTDADPFDADDTYNADEGQVVKLVDTSYAKKVQQILADVYGYSEQEFNDKIGGEIQDDNDETTGSDADNLVDNNDAKKEDDDKAEQEEDTLSPEDVFGDI